MKKQILFMLSLVLVFSLLIGCGGSNKPAETQSADTGEVYTWNLQSSYGPGDQTWDIQMPMLIAAIEKETNGKIKFKTHVPGSICEPEQAPMSVSQGMLDCALSTAGDVCQMVPEAYAEQGIPFFWEDGMDMKATHYDAGLLDYLREAYAKKGIYYGMPVPNGVYSLMTAFPVNSAKDLEGTKIRAYGSYGQYVQKLGAAPVSMPGGDIYMGIKLGTVEGCVYTFAELYNAKLSEVVDYVMEQPASGSGLVNFIINKKKWDALPQDLKDAVNKAMKESYDDILKECQKYDDEAREYALKEGVEFIRVSDENMKAFWEAGEKTAQDIEKDYPASKAGFDLIREWHKNK